MDYARAFEDMCYGACPAFQLFVLALAKNGDPIQGMGSAFFDECANYYRNNYDNCSLIPEDPILAQAQRVALDYYLYDLSNRCGGHLLSSLMHHGDDLRSLLEDCHGMAGKHVCDLFDDQIFDIFNLDVVEERIKMQFDQVWDKTAPTYDPFSGGWCLINLDY